MEFILFLSKIDKEIIELINKSNNSIEENTAL
ncbi:MAG: serine hydroxymethyltransferase, partial [Pelagibacterales bacterium]|nr:serine hydroxymethyltransferase [Pelagibacterales bacterium]